MVKAIPAQDWAALYRRYEAGETSNQIAASLGIGSTTLRRYWERAGYDLRPTGRPQRHPGEAELRRLYVDEQRSSEEIGPLLGVNPATVRHWLQAMGALRSGSEAHRVRNAHLTPEQRRLNAQAAHDAVRGRKAPFDELCTRAQTREREQLGVSDYDRQLAAWLEAAGMTTVLGKAIGPYNVDIASAPIAVEVFGGAWHYGGRAAARWPKRIRYLLDQGWSVVVVWVEVPQYPLTKAAAEYICRFAQETHQESQYRVIRGTGVEMVRRTASDDSFPTKLPRHAH